ncbi:unnamed protein product [Effrenium voratum]|nr:unnamed protein product [Effrenium voratum]
MIHVFNCAKDACALPGKACVECGKVCSQINCKPCQDACSELGNAFQTFWDKPLSTYVVVKVLMASGMIYYCYSAMSTEAIKSCHAVKQGNWVEGETWLTIQMGFAIVHLIFAPYFQTRIWNKMLEKLKEGRVQLGPDNTVPAYVVHESFKEVFLYDLGVLFYAMIMAASFVWSVAGSNSMTGACDPGGNSGAAAYFGLCFFWLAAPWLSLEADKRGRMLPIQRHFLTHTEGLDLSQLPAFGGTVISTSVKSSEASTPGDGDFARRLQELETKNQKLTQERHTTELELQRLREEKEKAILCEKAKEVNTEKGKAQANDKDQKDKEEERQKDKEDEDKNKEDKKAKGKGKAKGPKGKAPPAGLAKGKSKGKGETQSCMPEVQPRTAMKKLFWSPLKGDASQSVWAKIHQSGADFDVDELEANFSEVFSTGSVSPVKRPAVQQKHRRVFDEKRRREIWFMLALMPERSQLLEAVEGMSDAILLPEKVELLQMNLPTAADVQLINDSVNSTPLAEGEEWDAPEDFVQRSITAAQAAAFAFAENVAHQPWSAGCNMPYAFRAPATFWEELCRGAEILMRSKALERLLALVLFVGNYLNGGTARGRAEGFDLETLPKLSKLRGRGSETLLDYLVSQTESAEPGLLGALFRAGAEEEMVKRARKHRVVDLLDELKCLIGQAEGFLGEGLAADGANAALIKRKVQVEQVLGKLRAARLSFETEWDPKYEQLCLWFQQEGKRGSEEFFGIWESFLGDLKKAWECHQREHLQIRRALSLPPRRRSVGGEVGSKTPRSSPRPSLRRKTAHNFRPVLAAGAKESSDKEKAEAQPHEKQKEEPTEKPKEEPKEEQKEEEEEQREEDEEDEEEEEEEEKAEQKEEEKAEQKEEEKAEQVKEEKAAQEEEEKAEQKEEQEAEQKEEQKAGQVKEEKAEKKEEKAEQKKEQEAKQKEEQKAGQKEEQEAEQKEEQTAEQKEEQEEQAGQLLSEWSLGAKESKWSWLAQAAFQEREQIRLLNGAAYKKANRPDLSLQMIEKLFSTTKIFMALKISQVAVDDVRPDTGPPFDAMDATDEAAKLQKLSMKLADRLHGVEGNPTDLFCRFIDEERWLSMSVLLMDKHLKAEKCPASRASPVRMLSQSRGMLLGHPKLPEKFQAETWLGQNPKSLLLEVARKRGYNQPHFEVYPETEENKSWRATVQICSEEESKFAEGLAFANKMDTQHDAALAMLRQLQAEDEAAGVRHHPLREGFLACLRRLDKGGAGAVQGSKVLCRYQITLAGKASDSVPMLVERHEKLSCVLGSRVLHPALEDLLGGLAVGEEATAETDCRYEGIDCTMTLSVQLQELQLPETPLEIPKKVVKFDPPLSKQRQNFIVQALKGRNCSSALDLGCGDGQLLEALLSNGLERVLGVELSEKRVKACRKRLKDRAEVICADFVQVVEGVPPWMAFAEGVQAVVLCEVLEHLPDVAMPRLPGALFALQPQVVVVTSPNADFGESSDEEEAEAKPRQFRHSDHEREWSRQEFRSWAEAACDAHGYWISEFGGVGHLDGFESQGPCTQLCVFERRDEEAIADPNSEESEHRLSFVMAEQVDVEQLKAEALRSEDLGGGLWKYVHREGLGNLPAPHARVNLHYATFLGDGKRVDTSREKKRSTPFAFQLGGQQALAAWQLAAASMRPGEVAWVYSPSSFAYGERGAPPLVPGDAAVYFALELNFARAPGTVRFFGDLTAALQEAEKHMEVGRGDVKRQAFAQARQAFRRAMAAVPEKLLLGRSQEEISSFATLERAALLNQALCCLRLGEATEKAESLSHLRDALHACDSLFQRHGVGDEVAESLGARPELLAALREASLAEGGTWMAKAHFRRGMAKEKLQYLADALVDYQAALKLEPGDGMVQRHLASLKARQQKAELKPERMFAGILQRERSEREKEEAAAELAEKKRRREQRLAKSGQSEVSG